MGLELEAILFREDEPVTREEFLRIIERFDGEEVRDPCTNQIVGKKMKDITIKSDTTSAIMEISLEPKNSFEDLVEEAFNILEEVKEMGFKVYDKGYFPSPGKRWYLRNATPRGHYRLLHWYGYSHWEIATMASSQIWIDVKDLTYALSAINTWSPVLLERFWNSPFNGWREYRVKAWIDFSKTSWACPPNTWAPRPFSSPNEIILDILSGNLQEAEPCKDLSALTLRELAESYEKGEVFARDVNMGITKASREEVSNGMQRWVFRPAIARWKGIPNSRAFKDLLEGDENSFFKGLKTMVEVRFLPFLPKGRLIEAYEAIMEVLDKGPRDVEPSRLLYEYLKAARPV